MNLKNEHARLMAEIQVKQESFVRKERAFTAKIEELEAEVVSIRDKRRDWMNKDSSIQQLKQMHSEVQDKVGLVQMRTAALVQSQEQELLRAFKQRLTDVQAELETEKMGSSKEGGIVAWMEKSKAFELKAEKERERADKEDRIFTGRAKEKDTLEVHLKLQQDDKEQLIKQLVAVKKHNAALRSSLSEYGEEKASLEDQLKDAPVTQIPVKPSSKHLFPPDPDKMPRAAAETRYGEVLKSLTRMLASERKAEAATVTALEEHNESISDLERALRSCVDEVGRQRSSGDIDREAQIDLDSFGVEDREKALEMWLTKDGVIDQLCVQSPHSDEDPPQRVPSMDNKDTTEGGPRHLPPIL